MRPFRLLPAVLLLVVLTAAGGCRGSKPTFESPYPAGAMALPRGTLEELDALLRGRTPGHGVFWGSGRVSISQQGVPGTIWFDATVLYSEPDSFRLRGGRFAAGTLFEVIVCGGNAWVHLTKERDLYEGTLTELRRQGGVLGNLSLQDMTAAILVTADLRRRLGEARTWERVTTRDEFFLTNTLEDGRRMTWRIRRADGLVREAVLRGPAGRIELRALYESYVLTAEGEPLPRRFSLSLPGEAVTVRFRADKYDPRSTVKPENVCHVPSRVRVHPLAALPGRDGPIAPEDEPQ